MSDPDADERDFSAYYAARYLRTRRVAYDTDQLGTLAIALAGKVHIG